MRIRIQKYINDCVKSTAEDSLKLLGKQGGYINAENSLRMPNSDFVFLLKSNISKVPTIENIKSELSFYINTKLDICLNDFKDFKKQGWDVEKGTISTVTSINKDDVSFEVNYPIRVTDRGKSLDFDRSLVIVNVRLGYIYDLVSKTIYYRIKNPKSVDRTELAGFDLTIEVFSYQNYLIYAIEDKKSLILNQPYRFIFALDFS